jgi:mono/diheme cytochrome c family protein
LRRPLALALLLALGAPGALAQDGGRNGFLPDQIQAGLKLYSRHCAPCHGSRMLDPQGALNLRTFPRDQRARFVNAVTKGKNSMPPWGDLLQPEDVDALWAYVVAGETP